MKAARKNLEKLRAIKRHSHHPLIHKIHKAQGISKQTLFYVKEYGQHSNVAKTIIRESAKIVIVASIISSIGGLALEQIKTILIPIFPLVMLLPALNDLAGDYGTIVSSRFTTMLHEGKIQGKPQKNREVRELFIRIMLIAGITAILSVMATLAVSGISEYQMTMATAIKIFLIAIIDVLLLVSILFMISLRAGVYYYKKQEDPNNFLIPIATSVADFGNMIILAGLIILFF